MVFKIFQFAPLFIKKKAKVKFFIENVKFKISVKTYGSKNGEIKVRKV